MNLFISKSRLTTIMEAVKLLTILGICIHFNGCSKSKDPVLPPQKPVIRISIGYFGDLTGTSIIISAEVYSDVPIISRGICWGTSSNPTIAGNTTIEGAGSGSFTSNITGLEPGTKYYARPYASITNDVFYGSDVAFTTKDFPAVTTKEIMNSGTFIITSGGDIVETGGGLVSHVGVCWSTNHSPTISDPKTDDNLISSTFYSNPYGLQPGTTYYIRAYAINIVGAGYGDERTIVMPEASVYDPDGNPYSSIAIGTQEWTVENLRTTRYANGESIIYISNQTDWYNTTTGAWTYHEFDSQFEIPYGKLYNWVAAADTRNICPDGWHVPGDDEWNILIEFLGGADVAGGKLKESGIAHWISTNSESTNSSGFTALPAGGTSGIYGSFPVNAVARFWSSTSSSDEDASCYALSDHDFQITQGVFSKIYGFSVRCIKDK
jgi:uncharacterized protein (TIGR02145 family)